MSDLERQFEQIIRDEISRRRLLRRGAAGALGVSALSFLAACGEETGGGGDDDGGETEQKTIAKGEISDSLYFANWPLYIEEDRGTLKEFEQEYGTKVRYVEEVNDNTEFFGKVRQQYDRGDSGGRDIHVVTDWMAARMMRLGSRLPGRLRLRDGGRRRRRGRRGGPDDREGQAVRLALLRQLAALHRRGPRHAQ